MVWDTFLSGITRIVTFFTLSRIATLRKTALFVTFAQNRARDTVSGA